MKEPDINMSVRYYAVKAPEVEPTPACCCCVHEDPDNDWSGFETRCLKHDWRVDLLDSCDDFQVLRRLG